MLVKVCPVLGHHVLYHPSMLSHPDKAENATHTSGESFPKVIFLKVRLFLSVIQILQMM